MLTLTRGLALVFLATAVVANIFPEFDTFMSLIPQYTIQLRFNAWNVVTSAVWEPHLGFAIVNAYLMWHVGQAVESVFGRAELQTIYLYTGIASGIYTFFVTYILLIVGLSERLVTVAFSSSSAITTVTLVLGWASLRGGQPLHPVSIPARLIPSAYIVVVLCLDGITHSAGLVTGPNTLTVLPAFVITWFWVRFMQSKESRGYGGDVSPDLALSRGCPGPLGAMIRPLSSIVWSLARAAGLYNSWDAAHSALEEENARAARWASPDLAGKPALPGTTQAEAQRRRIIALAALQQRLDAVKAAEGGDLEFGSLEPAGSTCDQRFCGHCAVLNVFYFTLFSNRILVYMGRTTAEKVRNFSCC